MSVAGQDRGRDLEGRVALVTGGGSGIGRAVVQAFAEAGAAVVINWHREHGDAARAHAEQLGQALAVEADVADPSAVGELIAATVDRFGGLDILVNNAGINLGGPLLELELDAWDAVMAVNLRGAFLCLQAAGRVMRDSGRGGVIINISSIHEDLPFPGSGAYVAAKGGLRMLMRNAALELAPFGIRVNNIAPGAIATPLNAENLRRPGQAELLGRLVPQGRPGTPEEVAQVALFLASARSAYVTGASVSVDGGMSRYAEAV